MDFPSFLLDRWVDAYEFATPPIRFDLAASTGPVWTIQELLALGGGEVMRELNAMPISYAPPQGGQLLRRQIAEYVGVDPDWVFVTTGASEALSMIFAMAAEPGASILIPSPAFPAYAAMAGAWGLRVTTYNLARESGYLQTADGILSAVSASTRLVLVNSPHNPTGSIVASTEIAKLGQMLAERRIPLLVDEVFHPLYFDMPVPSAAVLPDTIVVGDASKALSLSGLRIGWIIERDARRREQLIDARSYFTISGSPITEAICAHALSHNAAILARLNLVARRNIAALRAFMATHQSVFRWVPPRGGTLAFPWRVDGGNTRPMCEALARAGVLAVPGDCYDAPDHFRVGFAKLHQGFDQALDAATQVLRSC
jgi:aspartate/methionine/tyrosine aminotransferase